MEHKLIAYIENKLDASEKNEVETWLQEDDRHQKLYVDMLRIWKLAAVKPTFKHYDEIKAWTKIEKAISTAPTRPQAVSFRFRHWKIAAAAVFIITAGIILLVLNNKKQEKFYASSQTEHILLKDKSNIMLFPGSTLLIEPDFNKKERRVVLKGDARFEIAKDSLKTFIIKAGDMDVQVLGTSFTIQQQKNFLTVFVHSGKVQAYNAAKSVTAIANQKIVKDNRTQSLKVIDMHQQLDEVFKTQIIRCNDMRIDSLTAILEEIYNIDIQVTPPVISRRITSTFFPYESIEDTMENIALTLNIKWAKKGDIYILTM